MPLTDVKLRNAEPGDKPVKLFDGGGLYLLVQPDGRKQWRLKYYFQGKEKLLSMGNYPEVGLREAREARDEARKLLRVGVNPSDHRKATKQAQAADTDTFELLAREWLAKFSPDWSDGHRVRETALLERDIFPWLGKRPMREIAPLEILKIAKNVENRGALETAHRVMQCTGRVFRYAVATGRAERDPTGDLRGALPPTRSKHLATIVDPKAIGALLRGIEAYSGSIVTKCALRLAPLTFVRPGELRRAEWAEIDLDKAEWRIPAEKMKMRGPHIVLLSRQAIAVLKEIEPVTGSGKYVFPGARSRLRPMSENAVTVALRNMGYESGQMTGHGFRSMASTLLNEQGWNRDAIERQLAHAERDEVRAAYNYAEHLPERRKMMQAWADHLDTLKQGAEVLAFKGKGK